MRLLPLFLIVAGVAFSSCGHTPPRTIDDPDGTTDYEARIDRAGECGFKLANVDSLGAFVRSERFLEGLDVDFSLNPQNVAPVVGRSVLDAYWLDWTCEARALEPAAFSTLDRLSEQVIETFGDNIEIVIDDSSLSAAGRRSALRSRRDAHRGRLSTTSGLSGEKVLTPVPADVLDRGLSPAPPFTSTEASIAIKTALVEAGFDWAEEIPAVLTADDILAAGEMRRRITFYLEGIATEQELGSGLLTWIYRAGGSHFEDADE